MYTPYKDGTHEIIQGLKCHIPPTGFVYNRFTNQLEKRPIHKRSIVDVEQWWECPEFPKNYKRKLADEARIRETSSPDYVDHEMHEFRNTEWDRRINGFWFYLKGKPTYITGNHYFYLVHWSINTGRPEYRDTDRQWFYFWQYCKEDPKCYGMIEGTIRRQGKSYRLGCVLYDEVSVAFEKRGGIQSKTDDDAERLFTIHIANPFRKMIPFFIPKMDINKGDIPSKIFAFTRASSKGNTSKYEESDDGLMSSIDYRASGELAYDGDNLYRYGGDEVGKPSKSNIYRRWEIVKPCLTDNTSITGKAILTTTVEDVGDDRDYKEGNFKRLWYESDQNKRHKDGTTDTGLYKYFLSGEYGMEYDRYGFPKVRNNLRKIQLEREKLKNNPHGLASFMRKYPLKEEEMFYIAGDGAIYDTAAINLQLSEVSKIPEEDLLDIGNLAWENGVRGSAVKFVPDPNGRFKFLKKFNIYEECLKFNVREWMPNVYEPLHKDTRIIGIDPYDHKATIAKGSDGAAYLYIKYDNSNPLSETFVCEYIERREDPNDFYEDMCMLAFVSGAEVLAERNKPNCIQYFENNKFHKFLVSWAGAYGIHAGEGTSSLLVDATKTYHKNSLKNCKFVRLLEDWAEFNPNRTQKHDPSMAAGWTLVGSMEDANRRRLNNEEDKDTLYDFNDFC